MMKLIQMWNGVTRAAFDAFMNPFRLESPWPGMLAVSLLSAVILMLIFRAASNPRAIEKAKGRAIARLLEFLLYKQDIVVNLGAFHRTLWATLGYLGRMGLPVACSLLPFLVLAVHTSEWFSLRPLRPGDTAVLTVHLPAGLNPMKNPITLEMPPALAIKAGPVRVPAAGEVSWLLTATGTVDPAARVMIKSGHAQVEKALPVTTALARVTPERNGSGRLAWLTYPGEAPLPATAPVTRITLSSLQEPTVTLLGHDLSWLTTYLLLTLLFGFALAKPLGVSL